MTQQAKEVLEKYNFDPLLVDPTEYRTTPQEVACELKDAQMKMLQGRLRSKTIHGVYAKQVEKEETDKDATHMWLGDGHLRPTTESFLIAAQDGVIHTSAF